MRKDGKDRKTSTNLATTFAPGNGTNAMTSASRKPRTRHPAVAARASHTVVHSACRNASEAKTSAYGCTEVPPLSGRKDCWTTRARG